MFNITADDDNRTTERFVPDVLARTQCSTHMAPESVGCWGIALSNGTYSSAVCNTRAKKAGFNAPVSNQAMRIRHTGKK